MRYSINNTTSYHIEEMETLGWELTVCNSLEPEKSPIRSILKNNTTFGNLLFNFLSEHIPISTISSVLEIGGGYGFIMRDFLARQHNIKATMLDISPYLLGKQKESLKKYQVTYINKDFFNVENSFLESFDLVLLNENVGDFPTVCDIDPASKTAKNDPVIQNIWKLVEQYKLDVPGDATSFNFNLGAIEAVEKLCQSGIPFIYISEHSCEAQTPLYFENKIAITPSFNPEQISLKGHDEYTIRFSHLERVAKTLGYSVMRGNFLDFIEIETSPALHFILTSNSTKDEHEITRHFVEDLIKYEYILLKKK